jgi:hypothetical protein
LEKIIMREHYRRDGCAVLTGDGDDGDQVVVEAVVVDFAPARDSLHCTCGAALHRWSCRPVADGAELVCDRCHRVHARVGLGIKVHR